MGNPTTPESNNTLIAKVNDVSVYARAYENHRVVVTYVIPENHVKKIHEVELALIAQGNPDLYEVGAATVTDHVEIAENILAAFDTGKLCAVILMKIDDKWFGFDAVVPEVKQHLAVDAYWQIPADLKDWLSIMFLMQEKLNDFTFANNGITANDGSVLTSQVFRQETMSARLYPETNKLGPNSNAAQWMRNYWEALHREVIELGEELPWKWWSKSEVPLSNVREEIVDCWHFLISISIASGLSAGEIVEAYKSKYRKNIERQRTNYVARGDVAA